MLMIPWFWLIIAPVLTLVIMYFVTKTKNKSL